MKVKYRDHKALTVPLDEDGNISMAEIQYIHSHASGLVYGSKSKKTTDTCDFCVSNSIFLAALYPVIYLTGIA